MDDQKGVIYILTNPSFPEYVKIGYASDLERRMSELNSSEALPYSFRAYAIYEVNKRLTDRKLHSLIDKLNPDLRTREKFDGKERKREFYALSAEEAYSLLECIAEISGTECRLKRMKPTGHEVQEEEDARAMEKESTIRRSPLKFSMCNLRPGDQIHFKNDSSIKATIVDDRHIEYRGETMTCTALARKLMGLADDATIAGPEYFMYNGTPINEIRKKIEQQGINPSVLPENNQREME